MMRISGGDTESIRELRGKTRTLRRELIEKMVEDSEREAEPDPGKSVAETQTELDRGEREAPFKDDKE